MTAYQTQIPTFKNVQEEAEFWDTHDTTEFAAEFRPVKAQFALNLSQGLTIRLKPEDLREMRNLAEQKGVGLSSLARMAIKKMLREEKHQFV